ncbi:MAG: response regulator transcription factor [Sandaracinaceae bacterium]|nr:response regulator transcription factor [Sandaracinaceae bacterium]
MVDGAGDVLPSLDPVLRDAHDLVAVDTGARALEAASRRSVDLVLLDADPPDMKGNDVLRALRGHPVAFDVPVIVVSGQTAEIDRVVTLSLGADDYVAKPFSPRELALRVRAVMRRAGLLTEPTSPIGTGPVELDPSNYRATVGGRRVDLTTLECELFRVLLLRRGRVQSRAELIEHVWASDDVDGRTVDTHIKRLRRKLGEAGRLIETVHGIGYRLRMEGETATD